MTCTLFSCPAPPLTISQESIQNHIYNGMVFDEMPDYGQIMQNFINDQEEQLPHAIDSSRHNQIIDYLQKLAEGYSYELCLYRSAEPRRQHEMLVAMTRVVGG